MSQTDELSRRLYRVIENGYAEDVTTEKIIATILLLFRTHHIQLLEELREKAHTYVLSADVAHAVPGAVLDAEIARLKEGEL